MSEAPPVRVPEAPPVPPPPFPPPRLTQGLVEEHESTSEEGNTSTVQVLTSVATGRTWQVVRELRECIYGSVQLAVEFTRAADSSIQFSDKYSAIKVIILEKVREAFPAGARPRSNEDPLKEISVMQWLGREGAHPNVLALDEALRDDGAMYLVMPYCDSGELFDVVAESGRFTEEQARPLFRQLLQGVGHLQTRGVCHRDLSLENLMVSDGSLIVIIDFGMALRVPFAGGGPGSAGGGAGGVGGGGAGAGGGGLGEGGGGMHWLRTTAQGACGKKNYMSPEILVNQPFSGFAVDVWACGVILFIMLTGVPPFDLPHVRDNRFRMMAVERRLGELLQMWGMQLSPSAVDLLQRILVAEPRRRPTVGQLCSHPWVLQELQQQPSHN